MKEAGLDLRSPDEKIAVLVPRWHIETWLLHLSGRDVDEDTEYKDQVHGTDIKATAQEFIRRFRRYVQNPGVETHLPSIVSAFEETKRIRQALDRASS